MAVFKILLTIEENGFSQGEYMNREEGQRFAKCGALTQQTVGLCQKLHKSSRDFTHLIDEMTSLGSFELLFRSRKSGKYGN